MSFYHKVKENIIFLLLIAFVGSVLASCASTQAINLEKMSNDERYKVLSSKSDSALCNGYTAGYIEDKTELQIEEILRSRGISKCKRAFKDTVRYVPSSPETNTKKDKKSSYIRYVEKYANTTDKCQGKSTIQSSKNGITKYLVNCSDGREISYICKNNECGNHLIGKEKNLTDISSQKILKAEKNEQSKNSSFTSSKIKVKSSTQESSKYNVLQSYNVVPGPHQIDVIGLIPGVSTSSDYSSRSSFFGGRLEIGGYDMFCQRKFYNKKLAQLICIFGDKRTSNNEIFEVLARGFAKKFGQPDKTNVKNVQTRIGAQYKSYEYWWIDSKGNVLKLNSMTSNINSGALSLFSAKRSYEVLYQQKVIDSNRKF